MLNLLGHILAYGYYSRPIFVIGAGRSGTTALTRALGHHPSIYALEQECPFPGHVGELSYYIKPEAHTDYYLENQRLDHNEIIRNLAGLCFESCRGKNFGLADTLKQFIHGNFSLLKARHWCIKTFPNREEFLGLCRLFPKAKFLYILRNGMDMVQSRTRFANFKKHGFYDHCLTWTMNVDKYRYIADYHYHALEIRHDVLINDPETIFREIYNLLEVPFNNGPANFIGNTIVHPLDQPTLENVNIQDVLNKREPPYKTWSKEEKKIFTDVCGENMQRLGYDIPFA
ncbi:MAG: sulfotransferase [Desulfobulbaceae bacterium]|nr:sulfotransferase [Desulfobulbaceae bacterium]